MTISAGQLRAARGILGWSQADLAEAAKIGRATIADFKSGKRDPYVRTLDELALRSRPPAWNSRMGISRACG